MGKEELKRACFVLIGLLDGDLSAFFKSVVIVRLHVKRIQPQGTPCTVWRQQLPINTLADHDLLPLNVKSSEEHIVKQERVEWRFF